MRFFTCSLPEPKCCALLNLNLSYIVSVLLSTKLMSLGSSSGIHFSSSSIQGYFRDEGTTISRGHSCLKIHATEMAWIVFPKPIWWHKSSVISGLYKNPIELESRKAKRSYLISNHAPAKQKWKLMNLQWLTQTPKLVVSK